jgi:CRP/FNR family cyclic AMP-dependent transcriptional regulator
MAEHLGRTYRDEVIVKQGDLADGMYVIQSGKVEVFFEKPGGTIRLAVLEAGDVFGEMALFSKSPRSATVRAFGEARILKVDKRGFFARVHEDPTLAFRILHKMADRIRDLDETVARLESERNPHV